MLDWVRPPGPNPKPACARLFFPTRLQSSMNCIRSCHPSSLYAGPCHLACRASKFDGGGMVGALIATTLPCQISETLEGPAGHIIGLCGLEFEHPCISLCDCFQGAWEDLMGWEFRELYQHTKGTCCSLKNPGSYTFSEDAHRSSQLREPYAESQVSLTMQSRVIFSSSCHS